MERLSHPAEALTALACFIKLYLIHIATHPRGRAYAAVFASFLSLAFARSARACRVAVVPGGTGGDGALANLAKASKLFAAAFNKAGKMCIGQFGPKTDGQLVREVDTTGNLYIVGGTALRLRAPGHLCGIGEN